MRATLDHVTSTLSTDLPDAAFERLSSVIIAGPAGRLRLSIDAFARFLPAGSESLLQGGGEGGSEGGGRTSGPRVAAAGEVVLYTPAGQLTLSSDGGVALDARAAAAARKASLPLDAHGWSFLPPSLPSPLLVLSCSAGVPLSGVFLLRLLPPCAPPSLLHSSLPCVLHPLSFVRPPAHSSSPGLPFRSPPAYTCAPSSPRFLPSSCLPAPSPRLARTLAW